MADKQIRIAYIQARMLKMEKAGWAPWNEQYKRYEKELKELTDD